ncbi:putative 28S rRNA (cytosine-C(5))-methyltransferase [Lobulomyces angularis]|nr:putative 28S rRNA (cytosine-C(5))-methyltransferase [Lobulomyces angularis]
MGKNKKTSVTTKLSKPNKSSKKTLVSGSINSSKCTAINKTKTLKNKKINFLDESGEILKKCLTKKVNLKNLIYSKNIQNQKKNLLKIITQTLKFKKPLQIIIKNSNLLAEEKSLDEHVALLLTYQLLFFRGLKEFGYYKKIVLKHKETLRKELLNLKNKMGVIKNEDLIDEKFRIEDDIPRYVRVNKLKASMEEVINVFKAQGYELINPDISLFEDAAKVINSFKNLKSKTFMRDIHLNDLLIFSKNTDFHDNKLLLNGSIILQDKASCFPAYILNPPKGSHIIDCCAAPGNKTSHLASIIDNDGRIFAFDHSERRLQTLNALIKKAGCSSVTSSCENFLNVDPNDEIYKDVEYILLDPSCSGSGIVSRMDLLISQQDHKDEVEDLDSLEKLKEEEEMARLKSLADFQLECILHCFKFPNIKKICYSTCSVNTIENEEVVMKALSQNKNFQLCEKKKVLDTWKNRGLNTFQDSEKMLRSYPEQDFTIGFFVALFEKIEM